MIRILIKIVVTALIITGIAELGKRFNTVSAILASLPLTSIIAIIWLYTDTKDIEKISSLSYSIFWIVIPSLVFFIALPVLLKTGLNFWLPLVLSCTITAIAYFVYIYLMEKLGIQI